MMDRCDIECVSRLKVENQMCDRNIVFLMGQISEKEGFAATLTHEVFHRFYQQRIGKIWEEVSANEVKIRWNEQQIESIEDKWRRERAEQLAALVSKESVDLGYEHCSASLAASCKAPITACRQSASQRPAPSQRGSYVLEPETVASKQTMVRSPGGQGAMFDEEDGDSDEPPAHVPATTHAVAPAATEPVQTPPAESVAVESAASPEDVAEGAAEDAANDAADDDDCNDDGNDDANETAAPAAAPAAAAATAPRQIRHHHPYKQKKKKHKHKRRR